MNRKQRRSGNFGVGARVSVLPKNMFTRMGQPGSRMILIQGQGKMSSLNEFQGQYMTVDEQGTSTPIPREDFEQVWNQAT